MTKKQNNNWIERFDKFIRKIEHFDIRSRDEVLDYIRSERLKWKKEMREMIGEDEKKVTSYVNIPEENNFENWDIDARNRFRHQLLEQLGEEE